MYRRDAFLFIINFCILQLGMMQHAQPRAHIPLDIPPFPRRSALVHWLVLCSLAEPYLDRHLAVSRSLVEFNFSVSSALMRSYRYEGATFPPHIARTAGTLRRSRFAPHFHSTRRPRRSTVLQIVKPNSGGAPPFRAVRRPRSAAAADVLLYTYKWRTFIPGMNPELAKMLSSMERARA